MRLLAAVALVALPGLAFADTITFIVPNITVAESNSVQTGYFDVAITDTASNNTNLAAGGTLSSTGGSDVITGTSVEIQTNGTSATYNPSTDGQGTIAGGGTNTNNGITLIYNDDATATGSPTGGPLTYIYTTDSAVDPSQNGSGDNNSFNNQDVFLNDVPTDNGPTLSAGSPLGLLRVEYSIPANFVGAADLTLITSQPTGNLPAVWGDTAFNANTPLVVSGSITVTPEPTSMVLLVLGAIGLFGVRRLRSR